MLDFFVYCLVAGIVFFIGYMSNSKRGYVFCLLVLFAFTATRYQFFGGTDSYIYKAFFLNSIRFADIFNGNKYGFGYAFLNWAVRYFSDNYYVYQTVYAAITILLLDRVLRELDYGWGECCIVLYTYLCLRFVYNEWVMLRQNVSNLIFWIVLLHYFKQDGSGRRSYIIKAVSLLGVACLFHTSAIIATAMIAGVFIIEKIPFKAKVYAVPISTLVLRIFGGRFIGPIVKFMSVFISDRYAMYENTAEFSSNTIYLVLRLLFFFVYCFYYEQNTSENKESVLNIMSFMIIVSGLDYQIISRIMEYFAIGLYASTGQFFQVFNTSSVSKRIAELIFFFCMLVVFLRFVGYFGQGYQPLVPYHTFFYRRGL